ncbi:hypothetical protein RMATCC62417_10514 [Rhizopus microsporus]|nr:hypothetical protein RMATCC62417_10514 [Rhizopus microsporus]CEJ01824.1 hypothetical protein RMCBS344292_15845 [Rhizopus microsporus]
MLTSEDLKIVGQYVDNEPEQDHRVEQHDDNSNSASAEIKPDQQPIQDSIDAAISGKTNDEEGYESSDLELSSDSSGSDSSSDEEDKEEEEDKPEEEEEDELYKDGVVKTANEITEVFIEKPEFEVTAETEIVFAGHIYQKIQNVIVVQSRPGSEHSTLDIGSLLVYENREIMGEVFETFGPIARPFYTVRFNDETELIKELTVVGAPVFYVPSYQKTQIVPTEALKKIQYTDASNVYDEEIDEDEMEFSDDEKELAYRQERNKQKKMKKKRALPEGQETGENKKRPKPTPRDFDAALASYEAASSPMPARQQQSYADFF